MKDDMLEWAQFNLELLKTHHLYATGTTGWLLEHELNIFFLNLRFNKFFVFNLKLKKNCQFYPLPPLFQLPNY